MIENVKIGNIDYHVKMAHKMVSDTPERGEHVLGEVYYGTAEILIEDEQCEAMQHQTLMHEIIHVILEQSGHANSTPEDTVVALGYGITALIQNNAELIGCIMGRKVKQRKGKQKRAIHPLFVR